MATVAGQGDLRNDNVRALFLVAHPDDETIGASAALGRLSDSIVVYLTDGAPRDPRLRSPRVPGDREFYACVRAEEAASALALVGLPRERILCLGGIDQDSINTLPTLLEAFTDVLKRLRPDVIITHPYEGGHPDHDVAALLAYLASRLVDPSQTGVPDRLEMTSYHALHDRRVTGEFLPYRANCASTPSQRVLRVKLSPKERARKVRMLGCFISQWHLLSEFPLEPEQLRIAPAYDFTKPPHEGPLWYEYLGWPMVGQRWREIAAETLRQWMT